MGKRRFLAYVGKKHARASICEGDCPDQFLEDVMSITRQELPEGKRAKTKGYSHDPVKDSVSVTFYYGNKDSGGEQVKQNGLPILVALSRGDVADGPPAKLRTAVETAWGLAQAKCPQLKAQHSAEATT